MQDNRFDVELQLSQSGTDVGTAYTACALKRLYFCLSGVQNSERDPSFRLVSPCTITSFEVLSLWSSSQSPKHLP